MTYKRFDNVPVWQTAAELRECIEQLLQNPSSHAMRTFQDQLDGTALSAPNNIAERFQRNTTSQLPNFNYIARGTPTAVRSMLTHKERYPKQVNRKSGTSNLRSLAESRARHLCTWTETPQNSHIEGHSYITAQTHPNTNRKTRRNTPKRTLAQTQPAPPLRNQAEKRSRV